MSELFPMEKTVFVEYFTKMASLLNKTVNKDQMSHWYHKAKNLNVGCFEETVDQFVELGKFPIWSDFRRAYKRIEISHGTESVVDCEFCEDGWVFYWRRLKNYKTKVDLMATDRCKLCNPDRYGRGYDAHLNPNKLRIIDFNLPYPWGQEGLQEINPKESSSTVDGKKQSLPSEAPKSSLKSIIKEVGTQTNTPAETQEFDRKKALEADFEREVLSAREADSDFPWF